LGAGRLLDDFEYEDSPLNHGWTIYDPAGTVSTVSDAGRPGRVMRTTTGEGTGFGIKYPASGLLDLPYQRVSVWIKDTDHFYFYVRVHATNGSDYYIAYTPTSGAPYSSDNYAFIPIGSQYRDGTWRELNRDLSADLQSVFGVGVAYVRWFCIRGDYDLDDLVLFGSEVATRYYYFPSAPLRAGNGQRVAMRQLVEGQADVVYWLVGDRAPRGSSAVMSEEARPNLAEGRAR